MSEQFWCGVCVCVWCVYVRVVCALHARGAVRGSEDDKDGWVG